MPSLRYPKICRTFHREITKPTRTSAIVASVAASIVENDDWFRNLILFTMKSVCRLGGRKLQDDFLVWGNGINFFRTKTKMIHGNDLGESADPLIQGKIKEFRGCEHF
jgi:hypothetical protein